MQTYFKAACWDWARSSVVEDMSSIHKALALIFSTAKQASKQKHIHHKYAQFIFSFSVCVDMFSCVDMCAGVHERVCVHAETRG